MSQVATKADMIRAVADAAGITRQAAEKAINALLDNIATELKQGSVVRLAGFGAFRPTFRKPRKIVLHGDEKQTRGVHTATFTPYETLKQYAG